MTLHAAYRRRICAGLRTAAFAGALALATSAHAAPLLGDLAALRLFGGTGSEQGTGIAVDATGVYFSGTNSSAGEGIVGRYTASLGALDWNRGWPGAGGGDNFSGIALGGSQIVVAGSSFSQTTDTVGGKENKGVTVAFSPDGTAGPAAGGAAWLRQTPAAPGAFAYGGGEGLNAVHTAVEGANTYVYATGSAQSGFFNGGRLFASKLDAAGNVLWTRTDTTAVPFSGGNAVAADATGVYVAGRSDDSGVMRPHIRKYDLNGNLLWTMTSSANGEYRDIYVDGGRVVAVGYASGNANGQTSAGGVDALVEVWDTAGALQSTRLAGTAQHDFFFGATVAAGHLFVVGASTGDFGGQSNDGLLDAIVTDWDLASMSLVRTLEIGSAMDDMFTDVAFLDASLYAVGYSFGSPLGQTNAGESDIMLARFDIAQAPAPGSAALLSVAVLLLGAVRRGRHRTAR
jgi:hypothetical protein